MVRYWEKVIDPWSYDDTVFPAPWWAVPLETHNASFTTFVSADAVYGNAIVGLSASLYDTLQLSLTIAADGHAPSVRVQPNPAYTELTSNGKTGYYRVGSCGMRIKYVGPEEQTAGRITWGIPKVSNTLIFTAGPDQAEQAWISATEVITSDQAYYVTSFPANGNDAMRSQEYNQAMRTLGFWGANGWMHGFAYISRAVPGSVFQVDVAMNIEYMRTTHVKYDGARMDTLIAGDHQADELEIAMQKFKLLPNSIFVNKARNYLERAFYLKKATRGF